MSNEINVSEDLRRLDFEMIFNFISERSSWARGISRDRLQKAIENSMCFGAYLVDSGRQVGFARVISDRATFANLVDVFVLEQYRGLGVSIALMQCIMQHPDLVSVRRFTLVTSTAGWLYEKFGFSQLHSPQYHMEILRPDIYLGSVRDEL